MAGLVDLRRIDVSSPEVLVVTTGQGSEVTFGLADFDQQLRRWHDHFRAGPEDGQGDRHARSRGHQQYSRCAGSRPAPSRPRLRSRPNPYAPRRNMFNASSIIVGLEIGTSKVCAVVGELGADGALNIVGLGQSRSRGVRKGEIADALAGRRGRAPRHCRSRANGRCRNPQRLSRRDRRPLARLQQSRRASRSSPPTARFPKRTCRT